MGPFQMRTLTAPDYDQVASLLRALRPEVPWSAQDLRQHDATNRAVGLVGLRLVVEEVATHRVVGHGELGQNPRQNHPGKYFVDVGVLPEFRSRGIGTQLYDALVAAARDRNAISLRTAAAESDPGGVEFARRRSFVERRRTWQSVLEVAGADVSSFGPVERELVRAGLEFTTLGREGPDNPEVIVRLHDLDQAGATDMPRLDRATPISLEQYRRLTLESPSFFPPAWFLAKDRDQYVAMSYAIPLEARPGALLQQLTCTRPQYRRRGIAAVLKSQLIRYAQAAGYTSIRTFNDSENQPMWALNQKLGFRREETILQFEKTLS